MKKFSLLILSVLIIISPVFVACGNSSNPGRTVTKPANTPQYNNVFNYYDSLGGSYATFFAERIEINEDFSAKITYSFSKKITRAEVEKAFEKLNERIYSTSQYVAGNRLFYVEDFKYTETELESIKVFCANLNYACTNNYKTFALEDFIKAGITSTEISGNFVHHYFKDTSGNTISIEKSEHYSKSQQNYKILAFDGYNSSREVVYKVDGKIAAYYSEKTDIARIDKKDEMTVKLNNSSSYKLYILYEIEKEPDPVWWLIGGAIALVVGFAVFLTVKLVRAKKV